MTRKSATAPRKSGASKKIDERIASLDDWRGERLKEIRRIIHEADPDVVEEWKWQASPTWSHDGVFAVADARKRNVKLTFAHGAALPDPQKLFNSTVDGNTWRAIEFDEADELDAAALKDMVRAAVAYNAAGPQRPVILAGGNPQIARGDGDGPVQAYIDAMPEWKRDIGRRLDALIIKAVPNVRKAVRWNSPFYGTEEHGWFLNLHVLSRNVKVTFLNGASLDPMPPAGGKDPDARWINIKQDGFDEAQLTDWFRQSANLPAWKGF